METLSSPQVRTFGEAKRDGFKNLPPDYTSNLLYLEQLAVTTNVDISNWPVDILDTVKIGDKRAINKVFFEQTSDVEPTTLPDHTETITKISSSILKKMENDRKAQIQQLLSDADYCRAQAEEYHKNVGLKLQEAMKKWKLVDELEQKNVSSGDKELKKIFNNPFWKYEEKFNTPRDLENGLVYFVNRHPIILTEKNPAIGVDRRLDFGEFRVKIQFPHNRIQVLQSKNNLRVNQYYHPYISHTGEICWGTALVTFQNYLRTGEWGSILELLSSLLTNYSPESSPYIRLSDFESEMKRRIAAGQPANFQLPDPCGDCGYQEDQCACSRCDHCEELTSNCECSICGTCENPTDCCDCHYCEACDEHYADGDACSGHFCPECDGCTGRNPCEEHYCTDCAEYTATDGLCEDACGECNEHEDVCTRCRDCNEHEGRHTETCSNRSEQPTEENLPF